MKHTAWCLEGSPVAKSRWGTLKKINWTTKHYSARFGRIQVNICHMSLMSQSRKNPDKENCMYTQRHSHVPRLIVNQTSHSKWVGEPDYQRHSSNRTQQFTSCFLMDSSSREALGIHRWWRWWCWCWGQSSRWWSCRAKGWWCTLWATSKSPLALVTALTISSVIPLGWGTVPKSGSMLTVK